MPLEQKSISTPLRANPYTVPPDQQGWRGLGLPEFNAKRKAYTLLWNEQVLVCGLLLLPGERSIRHSHETGELSITFSDALHPSVGYTPGGLIHGGAVEAPPAPTGNGALPDILQGVDARLAGLIEQMLEEQRRLRQTIEELRGPAPGPRILIDILFPPFRTTIDDAAYPDKRTVVGPWYD
jgi:hypothetical protein